MTSLLVSISSPSFIRTGDFSSKSFWKLIIESLDLPTVREDYVFTGVCLSTGQDLPTGRGVCLMETPSFRLVTSCGGYCGVVGTHRTGMHSYV